MSVRPLRHITLLALGVISPLLVFVWVARARRAEIPVGWDWNGVTFVHDHTRGHFAAAVMRAADRYGGHGGQIVAFAVAVAALLLLRRFADALFVTLAGLVGHTLLSYVKPAFASGFPSGHAMGAMVVGAAIAIVAWRTPLRWPLLVGVAAAVFLIGVSRIYVGAHLLSDVIGGWALGLACVVTVQLAVSTGAALVSARSQREHHA